MEQLIFDSTVVFSSENQEAVDAFSHAIDEFLSDSSNYSTLIEMLSEINSQKLP